MDSGDVTITMITCPECLGTKEQCKKCGGQGQVARRDVVVKVKPMMLKPKQKEV
jgi:DnaJ-class molecular chaperone